MAEPVYFARNNRITIATIANTLTDLEVDISTARICTEKGAAIDSFYVREEDGGKILSPERQKAIERRLLHAINALARQG